METKEITLSLELYDALQKIKEVFFQISGEWIEEESDIIAILIGGFIDSLNE